MGKTNVLVQGKN